MKKKFKKFLSAAIATTMLFSSLSVTSAFAAETTAESSMVALANDISIIKEQGDLETAYVTWSPVENAKGYKVYVKSVGGEYTQIDNALVRSYGSYYRADAVGIRAGSYVLKVEAVLNDDTTLSSETGTLTVEAHDRSGYAFVSSSATNVSNGVGAYDMNGELKKDAVVFYITENNKDTIEFDVITSTKGATTHCTGLLAILTAMKKGVETRPYVFRFIGQVTDMADLDSDKNFKGDICIDLGKKGKAGVTIEGIGDDAVAYGWGLRMKGASNVEVRNIAFMDCDSDEGDDLGLQQDNDHVWVHNCDFFYGEAGSDGDQAKGDGALDCKKSTYVTMSYNHFWDVGKSCLLGLSEGSTEGYFATYHHNWFDHSDSRHPRIRYYTAHVYNNYYDGNAKYGVGSTLGSSVFVENNYFKNCKYPILTSMQGSDIYDTTKEIYDSANMATFSKEDGGTIKEYGNYMEGYQRFINQNNVPTGSDSKGTSHEGQIDAYSASSRDEQVPSTIKAVKGGHSYNNFDTAADFYSYKVDKAEDVPEKVMKYAGRMDGGDFEWTFNNDVDDTSYALNAPLKAAIKAYKSKLAAVGGMDSDNIDIGKPDDKPDDTEGSTDNTTEKEGETTSENQGEETTSQPAGTGKWDFGNSEFLKYGARESFVEAGVETKINGLSVYYPASGVGTTSTTAKDGTHLTARIKFNANAAVPTVEEEEEFALRSIMKLKAVKGETIKVYASASNKDKPTAISFADNTRATVFKGAANGSTSDVTVTEYKVETSGDIWIFAADNNAYIYKIQVLDASGNDSSGTNTEIIGDVDGDGVLTVNDAMFTLDYALNGTKAATDEVTVKEAFGDVEVTEAVARELLDKVLNGK